MYFELRVCSDEDTTNEDAPVGYYEIYAALYASVLTTMRLPERMHTLSHR